MRRSLITLAMIVATVGILTGFVGGALSGGDEFWPLTWLAWALVGFIILWQRPGNRVGRAMMAVGLAWGVSFAFLTLSHHFEGDAATWAELVNALFGVVPWLGIIVLVLIYPSGAAETRLERVILRATLAVGAVVLVGFTVDSKPMVETGSPSPLAVPWLSGVASIVTSDQSFLVVIVLVVAAIVSVVVRWRRSTGVHRAQYQWLLLGTSAFAIITAVGQFVPEDSNGEFLWFLGGLSIPAVIGMAVLRYRLFEIDRLISRTVAYVLVVGLLGVVFFAAITLLTSVLPAQSDLAIAASTLAVAALFNPVRKRVQTAVDRRFNRSRYDAQRVMDRFAGSLQDRVGSQEVVEGWVEVVSETMQPASVGVWVRGRS